MKYIINARDAMFGGAHGMEDWFVDDYKSLAEALDDAVQASYDIMDSYSAIYDSLHAQADEICDNPDDECEYDKVMDEVFAEDLEYRVFGLKNDYKDFPLEYIEEYINRDPEEFVDKYCHRIV